LVEAIDVFNVPIPKKGMAIDLGAAPGGWTRVLLNHNLKVYAVDPAELDKSLKRHPRVVHFKETAQVFVKRHSDLKFDLIVNDMRMDVKESVSLMGIVQSSLKNGGFAIMTLKLQKKHIQKTVNQAIAQLERWYQILGARQLFYNRSEVTVFMKKK
jgi:23S rRNA (cytidine2498-2'-O)-methyltransferase